MTDVPHNVREKERGRLCNVCASTSVSEGFKILIGKIFELDRCEENDATTLQAQRPRRGFISLRLNLPLIRYSSSFK